jgi:ribosomal protein S12 methylthiotransferase accessory factor
MEMKISFPGGKQVKASFDDYIVNTDQPKKSGGEGLFPDPFSLFISSLGTCAGFYVLRFCQERNIQTDNIKIILRADWNDQSKLIENIDITIGGGIDIPDKYHSAIIKAASLCTVKRHLENPPKINLSIKN